MSYATVEFADNYFKSQYGSSWDLVTPELKQQLLDNAMMNIDSLEFQGKKLNPSQENEFPRRFIDMSVSDDRRVAAACCEEAMAIFESNGVNFNQDDDFTDFKLGDISVQGISSKSTRFKLFNSKAEGLLKPYLKSDSFRIVW